VHKSNELIKIAAAHIIHQQMKKEGAILGGLAMLAASLFLPKILQTFGINKPQDPTTNPTMAAMQHAATPGTNPFAQPAAGSASFGYQQQPLTAFGLPAAYAQGGQA
jgi:hypothetical protein